MNFTLDLLWYDKEIAFVWVPGHVGISANSGADSIDKDALDGNIFFYLIWKLVWKKKKKESRAFSTREQDDFFTSQILGSDYSKTKRTSSIFDSREKCESMYWSVLGRPYVTKT